MRGTSMVTVRGQTAIPVTLRNRYNIKPGMRLAWIDDGNVISVRPIAADPVKALRGSMSGHDLNKALLRLRRRDRALR